MKFYSTRSSGLLIPWLIGSALVFAATPYEQANAAYNQTEYETTIRLLTPLSHKDGKTWALLGMAQFGKTDYNPATESFQNAIELEPKNANYAHWLGKTWGRRAELATPFAAPLFAMRAKIQFERAVALDPTDKEALNDLFDYYLEAPGFMGGGLNRAQALVEKIGKLDEAEGHYAQAQLADKRKQFDEAEQQLRRAFELAPRQVGRIIDLAKYVSKRGRTQESEAYFAQAEKMTPNSPRLLFERAQTYVRDRRNLGQARELLVKYIASPLTPDDPPREKAQELLRKMGA